jgi:hypothetical protein
MLRLIAVLAMSTLLCACGHGAGERIAVSGTVKNADGSIPTGESAVIWFEPVDGNKAANGSIEEDGSFTMMTMTPGDGVAAGEYKVVLNIWKNYRAQTPAVPQRYTDAATTPLKATVDADHDHFDFVVEP